MYLSASPTFPRSRRRVLAALALSLYTQAFSQVDPGGALPNYKPAGAVAGIIRVTGNNQMAALLQRWEAGFQKFHPGVQFAGELHGTATGIYGLEMRTADLALMGRPINPFERYGTYERSWVYPVEIEVASGSASATGKSPAYAIFVHKDNPLTEVTLAQLDGIFGAQRSGGWNALSWEEKAARPASANLRQWKELGVSGSLAGAPIHVYGPPLLGAGVVTYFQTKVLAGGAMWNEDLREYADRKQMLQDLGKDPAGIAYAALADQNPGVKALAVSAGRGGPFVPLTRAAVANRSYPLTRPVYIVYTIDNERAEYSHPRGDPRVKEFLRYILGADGQALVEQEGSYVALPAPVVREQVQKLNATGVPPERELLQN